MSYAGKTILTAETTISVSTDPSFRFYFVPHERGLLEAKVVDSTDKEFTKSVEVRL